MNAQTISRYQPGGDIYIVVRGSYGVNAADNLAAAARTGDNHGEVSEALAQIRSGSPLNASTASIFVQQITTDPLAAPLESANRQIGNAVWNVVKNPWVLAALVGGCIYLLYRSGLLRFKRRTI